MLVVYRVDVGSVGCRKSSDMVPGNGKPEGTNSHVIPRRVEGTVRRLGNLRVEGNGVLRDGGTHRDYSSNGNPALRALVKSRLIRPRRVCSSVTRFSCS